MQSRLVTVKPTSDYTKMIDLLKALGGKDVRVLGFNKIEGTLVSFRMDERTYSRFEDYINVLSEM